MGSAPYVSVESRMRLEVEGGLENIRHGIRNPPGAEKVSCAAMPMMKQLQMVTSDSFWIADFSSIFPGIRRWSIPDLRPL